MTVVPSTNPSAGIPLKPNFRYLHEPLTDEHYADWVVGREQDAKVLADRLMYSRGGSFLVTGFRGVGKTTFVHYAIHLIRSEHNRYEAALGDFELLDVWINLSRPIKPSELMHLIIRHLYLRLKEAGLESQLDSHLLGAGN